MTETTSGRPPGWEERRIARLITMAIAAAVVVADIWLLLVFVRAASGLPGGWQAYWYIPAAIAGIFVFALARFLRHLHRYREGE